VELRPEKSGCRDGCGTGKVIVVLLMVAESFLQVLKVRARSLIEIEYSQSG